MTQFNIFDKPEQKKFIKYGLLTFKITPRKNRNGDPFLFFEVEGDPLDGSYADKRRETTYSRGLQELTLGPIRNLAASKEYVDSEFNVDLDKDLDQEVPGPTYWAKWQLTPWHESIREGDPYWLNGDPEREASVIWDTDNEGKKSNPRVEKTSIEILDIYPNQAKTMEAFEAETGESAKPEEEDVPF